MRARPSRITPVIQLDSWDARKRAAWATSSGVPSRRRGCASTSIAFVASGIRRTLFSVRMVSGAMELARIPCGPA